MKFTVLVLLLLLIIILIIIIIAIIIKTANMEDVVIMIIDFVDESVSVKMLFSPFLFSLFMMSAIPAHKLQIIDDDDDEYESWEIKGVYGDRKIGEQLQYFVQWKTKDKKGKPIMEWIDVEDLEDAKDAISKFLELKRTKNKEDQEKETNDENRKIKEKSKIPKKTRTNMGGLTTIITIIQLFLMIMGIQGQSEITTYSKQQGISVFFRYYYIFFSSS
jgi:hypothetical protein